MNIEDNIEKVRAEYLRRMTQGDGTLLRQVETYASARGGKMLRPRMLLLAAASQDQSPSLPQRTLLLAVCVEMLHNASLFHDDVIDRDTSRRGQPTVNARWGNQVAVLVGDYLLAQIMLLLDEINDREISRKINHTVTSMIEAELLQQEILGNSPRPDGNPTDTTPLSPNTYIRIIDGKTANLFALAAELGNPAYREFGLLYGRQFQICDDIRDHDAPSFARDLITPLHFPEPFKTLPNPQDILQ